jgi:membrane protein required for colicin V production
MAGGSEVNWVDIVIVIYLILSVVGGAMQGLIRSVLSLIGSIVGIVLAANFYQQLGSNVLGFISNTTVANIVAFILIIGVVMIAVGIIATILKTIIKAIQLGCIDKLGGALFGIIMGALSASAFLAVVVKLTGTDLITNSTLAGFFLDKFPVIMGFLPSEFDVIRGFFK